MVDLQPQPQPLQSHPNCMNWISKSRTSGVATYFKMISGFCISRDWTHFLPPKLIKVTILVLKKWHFVYIFSRLAYTAPMATGKMTQAFYIFRIPLSFFLRLNSSRLVKSGLAIIMIWSAVILSKKIVSALAIELPAWLRSHFIQLLKCSWGLRSWESERNNNNITEY